MLYAQQFIPSARTGGFYLESLYGGDVDTLNTLESIEQTSFENNFLLQIILGAKDCHAENTLLVQEKGCHTTRVYSIDNEEIMKQDNASPKPLWLAGLPHADVPFSKVTLQKTLRHLCPERLRAYHRQKNFFSKEAHATSIQRAVLKP